MGRTCFSGCNEYKRRRFLRILVVEDEKKVDGFIAKGFEQEGHAVDVIHNGEDGA